LLQAVLYEGSAGRIGHHPEAAPQTPDTFTNVASLTKLLTATCLLQLVERGQAAIDEDLRPRLPFLRDVQILRGFDGDGQPILEDNHRPITLWHLLTHTSGLTYEMLSEPLMKWRRAVGRHEAVRKWTEEDFSTPLLFEPGAQWLYGTSIDWAGRLLEKVTGQTLQEYMAANIFDVVGMRDTTLRPKLLAGREERATRTAAFAFRARDGTLEAGEAPIPDEHPIESGGAGLCTTARDYAKFLQALMQGKVLGREGMEMLFKPQLEGVLQKDLMDKIAGMPQGLAPEYPSGMPANFAFGGMLNLEDIPGKRKAGSMMWSGAFNSHWVS
jgi:CubicO group peptidase (beta-lactamase class C family)